MKFLPIIDLTFLFIAFYLMFKFHIKMIYVFVLSLTPHILLLIYTLSFTLFLGKNINLYTFLILGTSYLILFPAIILYALSLAYIQTHHTIAYWKLFIIGTLLAGFLVNTMLYFTFIHELLASPVPFITGALSPIILQYFIQKGIKNDH